SLVVIPRRAGACGRRRLRLRVLRRGHQSLQVGEAIERDGVLARRQRPPDRGGRGDRRVLGREGLDDERTVVAGRVERGEEAAPVEVRSEEHTSELQSRENLV